MSDDIDLSEFDDWLCDNYGHISRRPDAPLSPTQKAIVERNVELLLNKERWTEKVDRFLSVVNSLPNEAARKEFVEKYHIHFDQARIETTQKMFDFIGLIFPTIVSFTSATFIGGKANFRSSKFVGGDAVFRSARFFGGDTSFAKANFSGGAANFKDVVFNGGQVIFTGAIFEGGDVDFSGGSFSSDATIFRSVRFNCKNANFRRAKFHGQTTDFSKSVFMGGGVFFAGAIFSGEFVSFNSTGFSCEILSFQRAIISGEVSFSKAKLYCQRADFRAMKLEGRYAFFSMSIAGNCSLYFGSIYSVAKFYLMPTIADSHPESEIIVELESGEFRSQFQMTLPNCARLKSFGATFHAQATFDVKNCLSIPDFRETKFDRPPNLSGLVIEEEPRWDRLIPNRSQEIVDKWRVLKRLANDANDHEKAGQFFANEMAAKRGTEITGFWPLLFSGIYYAFSNFGQSYFRPTAWMAFFGTFFATLYYVLLPNALAGWDRILFSVEYSLRNLIPFLGSLFRFSARPVLEGFATGFEKNLSLINEAHGGIDLFIYLGVVEQLIGGILFFLLLLGLRNVFRMK